MIPYTYRGEQRSNLLDYTLEDMGGGNYRISVSR